MHIHTETDRPVHRHAQTDAPTDRRTSRRITRQERATQRDASWLPPRKSRRSNIHALPAIKLINANNGRKVCQSQLICSARAATRTNCFRSAFDRPRQPLGNDRQLPAMIDNGLDRIGQASAVIGNARQLSAKLTGPSSSIVGRTIDDVTDVHVRARASSDESLINNWFIAGRLTGAARVCAVTLATCRLIGADVNHVTNDVSVI